MTILEAIRSGLTDPMDIKIATGLSRKVFRKQINVLIEQEQIELVSYRHYRLVGAPELPPLILEWMGYPTLSTVARTDERTAQINMKI